MSDRHDAPRPLPEGLRRAAREIREMRPSEGFDERLAQRLARADRASAARVSPPRRRWARNALLALVPTAAAIALVLTFGLERAHDVQHFQETAMVLAPDGQATWLDLSLRTEHHGDREAAVRVEAPESVDVRAHPTAPRSAPRCADTRCVHGFVMRREHRLAGAPLRIGITSPGRYQIHVEHTSHHARVREHFLIIARR